MNLKLYTSTFLLASSLLVGCGSSNDPVLGATGNQAPLAPISTNLSGLVRDENGAPVANVRVVAHERTTHAKREAVTSADGRFLLDVEGGVYDIGLHSDDEQSATCFYGPVAPGRTTHQEFKLHSSQGRSSNELFGKLYSRPGVAAGNRRVAIRPMDTVTGGAIEVDDVELRTSADGTFSANLATDHEVAMDVEIFNQDDTLDEWVDVGKLRKPCYVEFVTDTEAPENRLRVYQSEIEESTNALLGQVANPPDGYEQYTYSSSLIDSVTLDFRGGTIPISAYTYFLGDVTTPTSEHEYWGGWKLRAGTNGSWWWDYAININTEDTGGKWDFNDATGDTYSLRVYRTGWHKVSYNSDSPEMKDFSYEGGS